jgi:RHS repeat-associated protein
MYDDYNQLGVQADLNANFDYWLNDAINQDEYEEMIFFYHKDLPKAFGIGSSTQISDPGANIIQHIEYLPYGECFFERRSYWNTPYKFNAKELDAETGLYYYGARYYTPEVSIWLSVDPLAQERSWLSPYNYCQLNPVKLVDPTGMLDDDFYFDKDGRLLNYVENDEPDRVFILEENQVESDDPNLVPKPVFKQVDMSSEEIEKKMENNGYRKVTSKVEVTNDEVSTSVPTGVFGSRTIINGYEITVGIDEKYVEKDKILLGRENTKTIERTVNNNGFETYTYERYTEDVRYGNKEKSFSFINWYLKIGVTDCRRKSEINVKW